MVEMEKALSGDNGLKVFEIPLLFEAGKPEWVDFVVYVTASKEARSKETL